MTKEEYRKEYYSKNKEILLKKQAEYYLKNKEVRKKVTKEYQIKNRDKIKKYKADNHRKNISKVKANWIMKQYGLTIEGFDDLYISQNKKCAICGKELPTGFYRDKHIDHCHDTGIVRGILCSKCNLFIGLAKNDISILNSAIKYLRV